MLTRDAGSASEAVASIVANPNVLSEVKRLGSALIEAGEPGGERAVREAMARLGFIYRTPWDTAQGAALATAEWVEVLGDLPREALQKGVGEFNRSSDARYGFPSPGVLRTYALPEAIKLRRAASRAREAQTHQPARVQRPPAAERARMAAEMREWVKPKGVPVPARADPHQRAEEFRRAAEGPINPDDVPETI